MAYFKEGCRLVLQLVPLISHPLPITHSPQLTYSFPIFAPKAPLSHRLLSSPLFSPLVGSSAYYHTAPHPLLVPHCPCIFTL